MRITNLWWLLDVLGLFKLRLKQVNLLVLLSDFLLLCLDLLAFSLVLLLKLLDSPQAAGKAKLE